MVNKLFDLKLPDEGLVIVAGLPGVGKTYALIEVAKEPKMSHCRSYAERIAT